MMVGECAVIRPHLLTQHRAPFRAPQISTLCFKVGLENFGPDLPSDCEVGGCGVWVIGQGWGGGVWVRLADVRGLAIGSLCSAI